MTRFFYPLILLLSACTTAGVVTDTAIVGPTSLLGEAVAKDFYARSGNKELKLGAFATHNPDRTFTKNVLGPAVLGHYTTKGMQITADKDVAIQKSKDSLTLGLEQEKTKQAAQELSTNASLYQSAVDGGATTTVGTVVPHAY